MKKKNKDIETHTGPIDRFIGPYKFLSNFYDFPVDYDGVVYSSVEAAYQAAKTLDLEARRPFERYDPAEAKKYGRNLKLRDGWETLRLQVMEELLRSKFGDAGLRQKLLDTGARELIEGNYWYDRFWGMCQGTGENHLGKLLMKIRVEMRKTK
jgi:N-glycosidase YbiA